MTRQSTFDGETLKLVFSDEFNKNNRTFYPGDDPFWTAPNIWYGATQDMEWYGESLVSPQGRGRKWGSGEFLACMRECISRQLQCTSPTCGRGPAISPANHRAQIPSPSPPETAPCNSAWTPSQTTTSAINPACSTRGTSSASRAASSKYPCRSRGPRASPASGPASGAWATSVVQATRPPPRASGPTRTAPAITASRPTSPLPTAYRTCRAKSSTPAPATGRTTPRPARGAAPRKSTC